MSEGYITFGGTSQILFKFGNDNSNSFEVLHVFLLPAVAVVNSPVLRKVKILANALVLLRYLRIMYLIIHYIIHSDVVLNVNVF